MKTFKSAYLRLIACLLLSLCLLTGCLGQGTAASLPQTAEQTAQAADGSQAGPSGPENAASGLSQADEESAQGYEEYSQDALSVQSDFDQLTDDLFREEAAASALTLHYTLADPAAYGITDYDRTLGTVSLEDSQETVTEAKELLEKLDGSVRISALHIPYCLLI